MIDELIIYDMGGILLAFFLGLGVFMWGYSKYMKYKFDLMREGYKETFWCGFKRRR